MFVFFGVKKTSLSMLEFLISKKTKIDLLITIDKKIAKKNSVSGYYDLSNFAKKNKIKIYHLKNYSINNSDLKYLSKLKYNIGLAYGWQRIIKTEVLELFESGVYGLHGSYLKLPNGAGRSPFNWSLRKDQKYIYQNIFKYTDQFDRGPIFNTTKFPIYKTDDINSLQFKGFYLAKSQILKLLNCAKIHKKIKVKQQKKLKKIISFPKISFADSKIDFTKTCKFNLNIIRASSKPFNGSHFFMFDKKIVIIHQARLFLRENNQYIKKYKKSIIFEIYNDQSFLIKLIDGIIQITEYQFDGNINKYLNKKIY